MSKKLIVVDVQPFYHNYHEYLTPKLVKAARQYDEILWFYVGKELDDPFDNEEDLRGYLDEWGMLDYEIDKITFVEKTYGFFRGWMDTDVLSDDIITVYAYMHQNEIYDSRDLTDEDYQLMNVEPPEVSDNIYCPIFDPEILGDWFDADIAGGGRMECLLEIELLLDALEIPYQEKGELIY